MLIKCNRCLEQAIITSSNEISENTKTLYCVCKNAECGHTFTMELTFGHTLSPSTLDFPPEKLAAIQSRNRREVQMALI